MVAIREAKRVALKAGKPSVQLICEASGGYEQPLWESLAEQEDAVTLVQAVRVRQYARAAGILAKTDRIDARVLAAFGAALRPKATPPLSRQQKRLRELESQRRHLSQVLRAEENHLAQLQCTELRSLGRSLINKIQKQIDAIEECISSLIAQDQTLCTKAQKHTAITGVGARTAALVLAQMPELGQLNRRQAAALAGLAPLTMTAARSAVDAPSSADDVLCAAASTWPRLRPHVIIQSCRAFTSVCAPKANPTNSLSPQ